MDVPLIRPKVADLVFRLYSRPLHPELFEVLCSRSITRDGYTVLVHLTRTGHVLSWSDGRVHLEEITATGEMELPEFGVRLGHAFQRDVNSSCEFPGGVHYRISSQLEVLPLEQFLHVHAELAADGARKGMVFHCKEGNRFGPSPLGVVIAQAVSGGLSTTAFHTFPEELTLIKTQSLIEWER